MNEKKSENKAVKRLPGGKLLAAAVLMLTAVLFSFTSYGRTRLDPERICSLDIHFELEGVLVSDDRFEIYRVADVSPDCRFTLSGDFASYPVSLENLDAEGWRVLARTLMGYVDRDKPAPTFVGNTDKRGNVKFEDMPTGLYLIHGRVRQIGNYIYYPQDYLLCLPNLSENEEWIYDVYTEPKATRKHDSTPPVDPKEKKRNIKVIKVWENDSKEIRPDSVTVTLMRDGVAYESQVLADMNNWQYTWRDVDKDAVWTIVEENVPAGYTVTVDQSGTTFTVKNRGSVTPPVNPRGPLPQTGILWWPVPVLLIMGLLLIGAGKYAGRKHED